MNLLVRVTLIIVELTCSGDETPFPHSRAKTMRSNHLCHREYFPADAGS